MKKYALNILCLAALASLVLAVSGGLVGNYVQNVIMMVGINIIFAAGLNLVNGYMSEFSCGHGGLMCIGAYVSAVLSFLFFSEARFGPALLPPEASFFVFPLILLAGALAAAVGGLIIAIPSFRVRGDYLAIITIAANFIIIAAVENLDILGGARGMQGMRAPLEHMTKLINLPWMLIWMLVGLLVSLLLLRRLVNSLTGLDIRAVGNDETAAVLMGVNANKVKLTAFLISAGLAGLAGALYAHTYNYLNPQSFNILKSTEGLVMVYLGGMASLSGSITGAVLFTLLVEALRFAIPPLNSALTAAGLLPDGYSLTQLWKWVLIPLILILLMRFRPSGLMAGREFSDFFPGLKKYYTLK